MNDKDVDLGLKVNPQGSSEYDYQELLERGSCFQCAQPLNWELQSVLHEGDDRFCRATCCGTVYSMIPSRVRVVGQLECLMHKDEDDEEEIAMADEDFLKELQNMTEYHTQMQGWVKEPVRLSNKVSVDGHYPSVRGVDGILRLDPRDSRSKVD